MSGNKIGGKKAALKNLAKDPDFYKRIGQLGGRNGNTGGFAANHELARIAGRLGGLKSRRTCFYRPVHPELNRHKLFSGNRKEFWANRASWNESSTANNKLVIANHMTIAPVRSSEPLCDPLLHRKVQVPVIKIQPHEWS